MSSPTIVSDACAAPRSGSPERDVAARLRDFADLAKPRVTLLVIFTTAVGIWMAPGSLGFARTAIFLFATACLVGSANTLNCWLEAESDGRMRRTRNRPLPTGRITTGAALTFGGGLGTLALALLIWTTNALTVALGTAALLSYVLVYTPLKRVSWWALIVGAVPGAIPPLMGWTALTGELSTTGWVLFGILFVWQLPHFIAISLYLKDDYRRGGLRVLPLVAGDVTARRHLFAYTALLVLVSLTALPLGLAGPVYLAAATVLGAVFLYVAAIGLRSVVEAAWARRAFGYSLVYLTVLIGVLVLDAR